MRQAVVDPAELDLMYLGHFIGLATNAAVRAHLENKGYRELRDSHGFIVQHLLRGPHSIGELAGLLGITQQAVSKSVAELARNGYVQDAPSGDARVRTLRLSARGRSVVQATRAFRRELEVKLSAKVGEAEYKQAKSVLLAALDQLDAVDAIRERKVRP